MTPPTMTPSIDNLERLLTEATEDGFTPEREQAFTDELPALFAHVRALEAENAALRSGLGQCRDQFQFYADEHLSAGKTEKAATNQKFADLCKATLNRSNSNG